MDGLCYRPRWTGVMLRDDEADDEADGEPGALPVGVSDALLGVAFPGLICPVGVGFLLDASDTAGPPIIRPLS